MKHLKNTSLAFTLIILIFSSCGFQGRKYTTGHYWESTNKNEYEKRNENEELKQNIRQSPPTWYENTGMQSGEETPSKKVESNGAVVLEEGQKSIAPPSSSQTNPLPNNTRDESTSRIEAQEIEIERDTVPPTLFNMHKSINRQVIWGLVIASFSFDMCGAIIGIGLHEPELIFIPILAWCIFPFFLVPQLKKLKISINQFKQELESYKSTNAEKKWFKRESSYLENIDLLHVSMIAISISFLLLSLLMIMAAFSGG